MRLELQNLDDRCLPSVALADGVLTVRPDSPGLPEMVYLFHPGGDTSKGEVIQNENGNWTTLVFAVNSVHRIDVSFVGSSSGYYRNGLVAGDATENIQCGAENDRVSAGSNGGFYQLGDGTNNFSSNPYVTGRNPANSVTVDASQGHNSIFCGDGTADHLIVGSNIGNCDIQNFDPSQDTII